MSSNKGMDWMLALKEASRIRTSPSSWKMETPGMKFESSSSISKSAADFSSYPIDQSNFSSPQTNAIEDKFASKRPREVENSVSHYSITDESTFPNQYEECAVFSPFERSSRAVTLEDLMKDFISDKLSSSISNSEESPKSSAQKSKSNIKKTDKVETKVIPNFRETLQGLWDLLNSNHSKMKPEAIRISLKESRSRNSSSSMSNKRQKIKENNEIIHNSDVEEEISSFSKGGGCHEYDSRQQEGSRGEENKMEFVRKTDADDFEWLFTSNEKETNGEVKNEVNEEECKAWETLISETNFVDTQNSCPFNTHLPLEENQMINSNSFSNPSMLNLEDLLQDDVFSTQVSEQQDLRFVNSAIDNWVSPWDEPKVFSETYPGVSEPISRSLSASSHASFDSTSSDSYTWNPVFTVPHQAQVIPTFNAVFQEKNAFCTPENQIKKQNFEGVDTDSVVAELAEHLLFPHRARSNAAASIRSSFQNTVPREHCTSLLSLFDDCL